MTEPGPPSSYPLPEPRDQEYHGGTVIGPGSPTTVPVQIPRDPSALNTVENLRHEELISIHTSLGNICGVNKSWLRRKLEMDKFFGMLSVLCFGGVLGGLIALFPFLDLHPTRTAKVEYVVVLVAVGFGGIICAIARFAVHDKEIESVETVYERVDRIKKSYETRA